jgi:putative thiamine transport system permease protein
VLAQPGIGGPSALAALVGLFSPADRAGADLFAACLRVGHARACLLVRRLVAPLLSVPHAAAAVGLAFLIAPSGFLFRLISPDLTGWERPPDLSSSTIFTGCR